MQGSYFKRTLNSKNFVVSFISSIIIGEYTDLVILIAVSLVFIEESIKESNTQHPVIVLNKPSSYRLWTFEGVTSSLKVK